MKQAQAAHWNTVCPSVLTLTVLSGEEEQGEMTVCILHKIKNKNVVPSFSPLQIRILAVRRTSVIIK